MTTYASQLGKCYAKRGNFRIYKDGDMYAVYIVAKEVLWSEDNELLGFGRRVEASLVGYVTSLENAEYAFDNAEAELASLMS